MERIVIQLLLFMIFLCLSVDGFQSVPSSIRILLPARIESRVLDSLAPPSGITSNENDNNRIDLQKMETERKNFWKQISSFEKKAVELLLSQNNENIDEAVKLFAKSVQLKNQDPFLILAQQYLNAIDRKDTIEAERIMKAIKVVGFPPHIQQFLKKSASTTASRSSSSPTAVIDPVVEEDNSNEEDILIEEVDPSSNFSDTVTENIRVKVTSFFDAGKSDPKQGKYMFWYKVAIYNEGNEPVQIVARMWEIEQCNGVRDTVRGAGVMNTQPIIPPGEMFTYQSTCPLKIFPPKGKRLLATMSGAYTMCRGNTGQYNFTVKVGKMNFILPEK